jgi:hypothetical protein
VIRRAARLTHALAAAFALACTSASVAQVRSGPVDGESLGGFVLPTEPGKWPLELKAVSANLWKVGSTQRLYLRERVSVNLGSYDFTADRAVLWIERIPTERGLVTQLAVWFPETIEPTKAAGLGAGGSNLFVTASTFGEVSLEAVLVEPVAPAAGEDLARSSRRLAAYLEQLAANPPALRILPEVLRPPPPTPVPPLVVGGTAPLDPSVAAALQRGGDPAARREAEALPAAAARREVPGERTDGGTHRPIVSPKSTVAFAAESIELESESDSITLAKGAAIDVLPRFGGGGDRALQLRADRGVIFLRKGTLEGMKAGSTEVQADSIVGVYLEGEVYATDFRYVVRARRAYYDFATNRATMVDGVLRTTDRAGIPVIARAAELRQYSQQQFEANQARVSMSEFFEPHLSIGADRAVITEVEAVGGGATTQISARDVTFRAGSVPFFWMPAFEATGEMMPPISRATANYNEQTGVQVNTRWRLFSLLGIAPPPESDLDIVEEAFTNWGVGGGLKGMLLGTKLDLLGVYDFQNAEQTSAGVLVTARDSFRGTALAERSFTFSETAKLDLRGSYVSDESFIQTWRQAEFATEAQRETSAYLVDAGDRSEVSLLLSVPTNGVITNASQLASRPYQVRKYPEFAYKRWGDTLFGDSLAWQQEYSANLMAIEYGAGSAASTGVLSNAIFLNSPTQPAYGANSDISQIYEDAGYHDDTYMRLYTRQELSTTFGGGGWKFTPFTSGTAMGYVDGNPGDYDSAADRFRAILAAGFRSSADVMTSFDRFEVPTLDLHRLRHVLTPYVNTWAGWNTVQDLAYAVYDQEIEGATGGAAVQAGVRQRLQTMRGGPGNWQSVDWVTLDVGLTWNDGGDDLARTYQSGARYAQSPFPQYFAWRPELSQWGRNAYAAFTMAASSTLTFRGNLTYLLDSSLPELGDGAFGLENAARGSFGASIQHAPDVSTFLEYRGINNFAPDSAYISDSLLAGGVNYRISRTYSASFVPTYDLRENDFRLFTMNLQRELPDMTLFATFGYDAIQDQYFGGLNIAIGGARTPAGLLSSQSSLFASPDIDR